MKNKTYDTDNAEAESSKVNTSGDVIETKSLQKRIQQLEAALKKKDEALSFATNQQVEHLERLFEKKIMEVTERLEKNLEEKVKDVVENVKLEGSVIMNQFDQKISIIENIMSMSSAINVQKVLNWMNNLPD